MRDYTGEPMDGELNHDGHCADCGREGVVLLDGTLCERCHPQVWNNVAGRVQQFALIREVDESGVSGEGVVATGVVFPPPNERAVLAWLTDTNSVAVYDSLEAVQEIHGHEGKTRIAYF